MVAEIEKEKGGEAGEKERVGERDGSDWEVRKWHARQD